MSPIEQADRARRRGATLLFGPISDQYTRNRFRIAGGDGQVTYLGINPSGGTLGAAVAVMRMKEREVRDDFMRAGATTPTNAMSLADVGIGESMAVKRLMRRSIIREPSPGLFYFDEEVYVSVRGMRRRMALVMVVAALLVFFVMTFVMKSR